MHTLSNTQAQRPWHGAHGLYSVIALLCASVLTGCASIYSVSHAPVGNDVYGGVRLDSQILAAAVTNGDVRCGLGNCEQRKVWWLSGPALADLPFSLVLDTALLPYTLVAADVADRSQSPIQDVP
jgi:uncharacterized protein YceK